MPKPTIPEVMPSVIAYINKTGNGVGGSLHVVICDNNPRDCDVRSCLEYATERGDTDGVKLAETMLLMSRSQRIRIRDRIDWNTLTERKND